jgi:hypothetical protein
MLGRSITAFDPENKCPTNFSLSPSLDKLKLVGHQTDQAEMPVIIAPAVSKRIVPLLERVQKGGNAAFNRSEIHSQDLRFSIRTAFSNDPQSVVCIAHATSTLDG